MLVSGQPQRPRNVEDLIAPQLAAALDRLDLTSRRVFAGRLQGERRSKARGRSVEFEDYRPYVPGDDLRHVDWNVFARLDRFFIKIFLEEQDLALHVAVDASASMDAGGPGAGKLLQAQRIAMALAYIGLVNNNRVVLWMFDERGTRHLPPVRGRVGVQRAARFLIEHAPADRTAADVDGPAQTFTDAMRTIARTRTGKGVFVLLSDLFIREGYEQGLSLLAGGWDTTVMQVLSPGELDPARELDSSGERLVIGDLRLTDVETGRAAEVTVNADLLKRYLARLEQHQARLRAFLGSRGMTHVVVRSDADVAALLLGDLRRLGVLK